jgi:general secretion pathway protein A
MYTQFYGLKAEPFLLTPDHRFYFESRVHGQAMAHLLYGLNRGEGFIVITGDVGAGKTTIVQRLCATMDRNRVLAAHIVTTLLTGQELLRMVCAAFGIMDVPQEKDAVLRRLQAFFAQLGRGGHRALLVVDEAQNLSADTLEELRMLSNFQLGNVSPCQIFLVGQPQFRNTLADPHLEQLRQRIIASYHLGALSPEECGHYVLHRMRQAHWANDPLFRQDALKAVFQHSGGIPRRINTLCSRLLLLGYLDQLHMFTGEDVARVAADLRAEIGEVSAPAKGQYLGATGGRDTGLSARIDTLERRLELLQRITMSLAKDALESGRGDGS